MVRERVSASKSTTPSAWALVSATYNSVSLNETARFVGPAWAPTDIVAILVADVVFQTVMFPEVESER